MGNICVIIHTRSVLYDLLNYSDNCMFPNNGGGGGGESMLFTMKELLLQK